jgi:hypothetical protein
VQAFQRLHRKLNFSLLALWSSQREVGVSDRARRTTPYRIADLCETLPIETELCAVERTDQISADPLQCGVQ